MNGILHPEAIELSRFTEHRAWKPAGVLRGPQEIDFLVPRDSEQEAQPAVLTVFRNQCGFINDEGKVPAAAHAVCWAREELREPGELSHHVDLKRAIADAKPLSVVSGRRECFKCGDFVAVIFAAPIPD